MDYVPLAVGAAVGLTDGVLRHTGFGQKKHVISAYRGIVFLGGLGAELAGVVSEDISYGLMTAGATLLGSGIPTGFAVGASSGFPDIYAPPANGTPHDHSNCVTCGQKAIAASQVGPRALLGAAPGWAQGGGRTQRPGRVA